MTHPFCDFSNEAYNALLYGTGGKKLKMQRKKRFYGTGTYNTEFEGIVNNMDAAIRRVQAIGRRWEIEQVMTACDCPIVRARD